ncbi:hypothetical protein HDF16_005418 [Granulicella aggregans]|uniref:Uncharacterized protein n=1 Tax=Granulicella aggregans TaxID=474949 RepID=A0A7W7ZIS3_9BACT|nr:hypothetical protein [Granulicella aggregans]
MSGTLSSMGTNTFSPAATDVVWFPPNEKHWHGAAPTTAMTHIAIQERTDGGMVDWMEHVTEEEYSRQRQGFSDQVQLFLQSVIFTRRCLPLSRTSLWPWQRAKAFLEVGQGFSLGDKTGP